MPQTLEGIDIPPPDPEAFALALKRQNAKTQAMLNDPAMMDWLRQTTTTEVPKPPTSGWEPQVDSEGINKFANPNMDIGKIFQGRTGGFAAPLSQMSPDLDLHSKQLIAGEYYPRMLEKAKNLVTAPYQHIKRLMEHGYTPTGDQYTPEEYKPTGNYTPSKGAIEPDIHGINNSTQAALDVMLASGAVPINHSEALNSGFKGSLGARGKSGAWTPEMYERLRALDKTFAGTPNQNKTIIKNFREMHPDFPNTDANIQSTLYRTRNWGGANIEQGAKSTKDIELGSNFGNKGKLNTESSGEAMGWLQSKRPVDEAFVRDWAKSAGVPIRRVRETNNPSGTTKYIELHDEYGPPKPGDVPPKVRIPGDEGAHLSPTVRSNEIGNMFDTGRGLEFPGTGAKIERPTEATTLNKEGGMFANREALDAALKWRLSKAPNQGNWLIPEEMAPRLPTKTSFDKAVPESPNPDQLKLFSNATDKNTSDIAKLMSTKTVANDTQAAKTVEQLNKEAEARHQADLYRHALMKQGKDTSLFSNQTDPTTNSILNLLRANTTKVGDTTVQDAVRKSMNITPASNINKPNSRYMLDDPSNINTKTIQQNMRELKYNQSDKEKYQFELNNQKLRKMGVQDPEKMDMMDRLKLLHPELFEGN